MTLLFPREVALRAPERFLLKILDQGKKQDADPAAGVSKMVTSRPLLESQTWAREQTFVRNLQAVVQALHHPQAEWALAVEYLGDSTT
jgi:hypothetical protein